MHRKHPRRAACPSMMPAQALDFTFSCQARAEHLQQCAEFLPLRNRGLGPLAVAVLPIPFARRGTATSCAAVQSTAALFRRWRPAGFGQAHRRAPIITERRGRNVWIVALFLAHTPSVFACLAVVP